MCMNNFNASTIFKIWGKHEVVYTQHYYHPLIVLPVKLVKLNIDQKSLISNIKTEEVTESCLNPHCWMIHVDTEYCIESMIAAEDMVNRVVMSCPALLRRDMNKADMVVGRSNVFRWSTLNVERVLKQTAHMDSTKMEMTSDCMLNIAALAKKVTDMTQKWCTQKVLAMETLL